MIGRLSGTLVEKQPGRVLVDVAGVGYELFIPLSTYMELAEAGGRVDLHVHTHVREDAIVLFGFRTRREKDLFACLIGIAGVGPKTAIAVLSGLGPGDLIDVVRERDAGRLASIPGIGRKTADRILLDLADRIATVDGAGPAGAGGGAGGARGDLMSALINLGYNARVAADVAARVLKEAGEPAPPFERLLRQSLRLLSR
jgi:Holliday junction DNA helicase RuvA